MVAGETKRKNEWGSKTTPKMAMQLKKCSRSFDTLSSARAYKFGIMWRECNKWFFNLILNFEIVTCGTQLLKNQMRETDEMMEGTGVEKKKT